MIIFLTLYICIYVDSNILFKRVRGDVCVWTVTRDKEEEKHEYLFYMLDKHNSNKKNAIEQELLTFCKSRFKCLQITIAIVRCCIIVIITHQSSVFLFWMCREATQTYSSWEFL